MEDVLRRALELGEDGRWEEMARLLAEALAEEPEDPYLLCWLGVAERELDNDGAAYEYFKRCLAQEPLDPQLLAIAGSGLAAFDDPAAESALRAAALTGPEIPGTRLQYGAYLARAGLFEEALEQLAAARDLAPEDPTVYGELATAHALKGDHGAAIRELDHALELEPDDAWNRILLGLLYVEQDQIEDAAEALWRAAEQAESDPEAQIAAALAAAAVGWEEAAQTALLRAGYAAEAADRLLIDEAEERVTMGAEAARSLLVDSLAPSMLHDRLIQPL
ncbi:MAG: tetratricopeptide repeat protein [Longimicrobiales bacterium]